MREPVYYFAADLHLGAPDYDTSRARERHFVRWLDEIAADATALYLMGDVFDFWFEYRHVAPKGYVRLLGKLAELADAGVALHLFVGNHDMWYRDYLTQEIAVQIHHHSQIVRLHDKVFYLAHGDGLGPGDYGYKFLKKFLRNRFIVWVFERLHPNFGMWLALGFSSTDRKYYHKHLLKDYGEREMLVQFARSFHAENPDTNYFVFGHRHLPRDLEIAPDCRLIVLGDWLTDFSYLRVTAEGAQLLRFADETRNA